MKATIEALRFAYWYLRSLQGAPSPTWSLDGDLMWSLQGVPSPMWSLHGIPCGRSVKGRVGGVDDFGSDDTPR